MSNVVPRSKGRDRPVIRIGGSAPVPLEEGIKYKEATAQVDICFVFDTTGSMSDKIDGLVAATVDLVRDLATLRLDWQITTVPFGDLTVPDDRIVKDQPFVKTLSAAETQLRSMPRFSGGGNAGESSLEAIDAALSKPYRHEAVRVLVLITDEPALQDQIHTAAKTATELRQAETILFVASPDLPYYKSWAADCGGTWIKIGQTMDTGRLREMLRSMVRQVAAVADDVHRLANGSVRAFLALPSRPDRRSLGTGGD